MTIRIESIAVNGLGPIASIKWHFKDINLVYGRNEQGKTYLVEYLLRSLFENARAVRSLTDSGQVNVTLPGGQTLRLDPKSRQKLESHIFSGDGGKPVDLSRLCVVKGGELSFLPEGQRGISKDVLKDYLSDQRLLDVILKGIQSTVQESTWEDGKIIGKKHIGQIKEMHACKDKVRHIDNLLEEVDQAYSLGEIKKAKVELEELRRKIDGQQRARRAFAYELSGEIRKIEAEIEKIPREDLEEAKQLLARAGSKRDQIWDSQGELAMLEKQCEHYPWLESAIQECEMRPGAFSGKAGWLFVSLSVIGIAAAILFAFLDIPFASLAAGLLAVLFVLLANRQYQLLLRTSGDTAEVERIFVEFEQKFGTRGRSIAALKSKENALKQEYYRMIRLREQIPGLQKDLAELQKELEWKIEQLAGEKGGSENLEERVSWLGHRRDGLEQQIHALKTELAATQVQHEEYLAVPADSPYDPVALRAFELKEKELNQSLTDKEHDLELLKQRVCDMTGDVLTAGWDDLLDHMRTRREEAIQSYKSVKAQVGSGILVTRVINEMRERQDESIAGALASPGMRAPIRAITHSYEGVEMQGNELIVYNQFQRFPLDSLSTGAQEQVLLALRIGIAAHILKERRMFLILDDAFQHSDWQRREWLVDEMASLANIGWQILYFTMDDHIRQLFAERIQPAFPERYQLFELKQEEMDAR